MTKHKDIQRALHNNTNGATESTRTLRLLRIMQEIRNNPAQSLDNILKNFAISRSQFYKDRASLAQIGFGFEYQKTTGFRITEDRLTPIMGFSLSERITLLFALEHLSACGDGLLAAKAVEVGRKLAGGLESPFREQLLDCFDTEVTQKAYGVVPEVYAGITSAIAEGRRIRIRYRRSGDWTERWREVDPRRVYMRQRVLYLYARTVDETPPMWKVFRLGRIAEVQPTGICLPPNPQEDDGFVERQRHAFMAFLGESGQTVRIRFSGAAVPYILEKQWHPSQVIERKAGGSIILTLAVAEPMEVVRWARQFGDDAQVLAMPSATESDV